MYYRFFFFLPLQRLLSPSYRGLNCENSDKRQKTDLRNKHFYCLVFSYDSHLNTSHFFGTVHARVASMIFLFKNVYFKHTCIKRVLPESLERKYFIVHIAIFSCKFVYVCKLRHGIFFFTKCTVLNGDVVNNYVLGLQVGLQR